ncbi:hypothetical protein [Nguyenibacter vanlangensis]|uniref:Uncharacterized protein n=1 Tax=Nguyenibacter vanlangensis TaxID=1216886 RepID=A0A7Y7IWX3_9PROT|nr:hypothetical protein [Nguyenibacter vanlangensis]NVN11870.1 hypothetical protein [Nguyenibacter vanlangensis]
MAVDAGKAHDGLDGSMAFMSTLWESKELVFMNYIAAWSEYGNRCLRAPAECSSNKSMQGHPLFGHSGPFHCIGSWFSEAKAMASGRKQVTHDLHTVPFARALKNCGIHRV